MRRGLDARRQGVLDGPEVVAGAHAVGIRRIGSPDDEDLIGKDGMQARVYDKSGNFTGVYEWRKAEMRFKPVKMFLEKMHLI